MSLQVGKSQLANPETPECSRPGIFAICTDFASGIPFVALFPESHPCLLKQQPLLSRRRQGVKYI